MSNGWGYCGIAVYHPKTRDNVGTLWRSAYAFGAQFLCTVGRRYEKQASDTVRAPRKIPLFETANLKELKGRLPVGCQLVGVELVESAEDLKGFRHPSQACYLLGAEDHGLPKRVLAECHRVVQVPGLTTCLNVAVAGSLVLYDRVLFRAASEKGLVIR